MEVGAGDPAGRPSVAYSRAWKAGEDFALVHIEQVTASAEKLFAQAEAAFAEIERAPRDERAALVHEFVLSSGKDPSARCAILQPPRGFLAPLGGQRRPRRCVLGEDSRGVSGDPSAALLGALRRIATRSSARSSSRARAAVDLAEILDATPETRAEALEVVQQLLDEQPGTVEAESATLLAIAEYHQDPAVARTATPWPLLRANKIPSRATYSTRCVTGADPDPSSSVSHRLLAHALDEAPPAAKSAPTPSKT